MRNVVYTGFVSESNAKTFYLETFGCQMNAHDSEKVVGTLLQQGYRQVPTVEEAGLVLYNTCSIRDKAEQKVFTGWPITRNVGSGEEVWRPGMRGAARGREDF